MPPYPWLVDQSIDTGLVPAKIRAMQTLGVPYPEGYDAMALEDYDIQARRIVESLSDAGIQVDSDREIVALIAYLQRLGTDIKAESTTQARRTP